MQAFEKKVKHQIKMLSRGAHWGMLVSHATNVLALLKTETAVEFSSEKDNKYKINCRGCVARALKLAMASKKLTAESTVEALSARARALED